MGFDGFVLISVIYAVIGVQAIYKLVRSWSETWDRNFTQKDRILVDQAAFFVLVPVSVLLHEGGHAATVELFGGTVTDFGFYGFAGYVSYDGFRFSLVEQMLVAAAGTIVNLVLCLAAFAFVFLKQPPARAAINELLIQFAFISGLNAFVVYPVLDLASGLNGDWRQMYDGGVPWLTAIIVAVQAAILFGGYWFFTNPSMKARVAQLTDIPPGLERGAMGGLKRGSVDTATLSPSERVMYDAIQRVSSGWSSPVQTGVQRFPQGSAITLEWDSSGKPHLAAVRAFASGSADIVGFHLGKKSDEEARPQPLHGWAVFPDVDTMTLALRLAMETIDREDW
ncbi:MAG: site-2 protease family protein [Thermomicrobiales bacterium]